MMDLGAVVNVEGAMEESDAAQAAELEEKDRAMQRPRVEESAGPFNMLEEVMSIVLEEVMNIVGSAKRPSDSLLYEAGVQVVQENCNVDRFRES